jgi:3-oxoacyl-(acyl-carrier-protein) synthase
VTCAPAGEVSAAALQAHLRTKLPDYMIPATIVFDAVLPLTHAGKIDRKALAAGPDSRARAGSATAEPSVQLASRVLEILRQELKRPDMSMTDGFFDAGGDSILAVVVARRIANELQVDFGVSALLEHGNVQNISRYIADRNTSAAWSEPLQREQRRETSAHDGSVAIIGISCQLPGATDARQFWNILRAGTESIEFLDADRLRELGVPERLVRHPKLVAARATIEDKDRFDSEFFKVSRHDAQLMDPQVRLLLTHSWKAVEDAGYRTRQIQDTAVYMSATHTTYGTPSGPPPWSIMDGSKQYGSWALAQAGTIPTLVSHRLGFKGPSLFIHSNCSSSLVAMEAAFRSIVTGGSPRALVGAATLFASINLGYVHEDGMNFSSDGHLRAFDAQADGMIAGEGVAVVLLKRASDAIADGDHIYALLRGIAVNNDGGDKAGYYAPSVRGQSEVIEKALRQAGVSPDTVDYVEAHGTATRLGDPLEFAALCAAFRQHTDRRQFCGLGSV